MKSGFEIYEAQVQTAERSKRSAKCHPKGIALCTIPLAILYRPTFSAPGRGSKTQETLLRVLDQLDTFEGRSLFTTWVHKIAIRIALTELRRKRWRDSCTR